MDHVAVDIGGRESQTCVRSALDADRQLDYLFWLRAAACRTLHTMFEEAVADELIDSNPCKLRKADLPKKVDKDPGWRSGAIYTRAEVETIISESGMPVDRRVLNTLLALTGMRFGEVAALRWSAYDPTLKPLGMPSVHAAYCTKTKAEKGVKTEVPRRVPVHPVLARVLAEWKLSGWEELWAARPSRTTW